MVAFGELAREGFELIQQTIVGQLSDLFRARASIRSVQTKSLRLKASGEPQDVLRIHVAGIRNVSTKKFKPQEILVKITLVGEHNWYCEGKTKTHTLDLNTGTCAWNECIEFSRISDYTDVKIKVGSYKRFGRFKVLASTRLRLSTIMKLTDTQWFMLYKDKGHKQRCGSIQLSFDMPTNSSSTSSYSVSDSVAGVNRAVPKVDDTVCSDYLLKLVADLRAQLDERDQRIKMMQSYIDQLLTRILHVCPHILEK